jgi:hypothetical protein
MSTDINIKKKISIEEEGALLTTDVNNINFVGAGVIASTVGNDVTVTVSGGNGSVIYYLNQTVTQAPYKEFSSIVTTAVEQVVPATIAGGATTVVAEYQTPVGIPNTTVVPAGLWQFFLHFNAGSAGQNWIIRPTVYKRDSGGTETLIFTPDPEIVTNMSTTTTMYTCDGVFPTTTLLTTDRIVVKIALQNTTGVSQTASFRTEGSQHYSVAATTLNQAISAGSVTSVSGTAPIVSSGGSTPAISIPQATALVDGYLSSTDWSVFNAKVPATRNLTINGTTYDLSADRTWTISAASGIWGISNSSGVYTYYATYALARAAATSGQTIELFADVTETTDVSIILKDGVNINGNGHTYILSQASTSSTITDNAVACVCDVSNIIFKRSGGTPSTTNTATILLSGASKITGTAICYSSCGVSILITNASAELNGFKGITTSAYDGVYSNGIIKNIHGESYSTGYHYAIYSTGTALNCHGLGFGLYQSAFYNFGGIATNCSGTVTGSFGGGFANTGIATNCSGKAVGNYGFASSGTAINCTGTSTSGNGFSANGSGNILEKCSGYSSSGNGFSVYGSRLIDCTGVSMSSIGLAVSNGNDSQAGCINCTGVSYGNIGMSCNFSPNNYGVVNPKAISYYNNAAGHALQIGAFGNTVASGYFAVANASANCINSASVISTKIAKNTYVGSTTPVNANITQTMVNTQDNYGNILL